jgi:hypothetical protein
MDSTIPFVDGTLSAFVLQDNPTSVSALEKHAAQLERRGALLVQAARPWPGPGCEFVERSSSEQMLKLLARNDVKLVLRLAPRIPQAAA